MNWNLDDMDLSQLEELLDAVDMVNVSRRVARRHNLDTLDDISMSELQLRLFEEIDKRTASTVTVKYLMEERA